MTYSVQQIGITGPSERIGGSSPFHIDTKFRSSLPIAQIRERMDAIAKQYRDGGRQIEFSNKGVAGQIYNLDATPAEREAMLQAAGNAHAPREGWLSLDYYAPSIGKDRWHSSAEGAPIYVAGGPDVSFEGGTGGNYGNYGMVIGADGSVISKSGHGDNSQAVFTPSGDAATSLPASAESTPDPVVGAAAAKERAQNYAQMSAAELNTAYDAMRSDTEVAEVEGMKMHNAFFDKP